MRFELWHKDVPTFRDNNPRELQLDFPKGFTLVAEIEAEQVEAVYGKSQNAFGPWFEGPDVTVKCNTRPGFRSTSVGDVIVNVETADAFTVDGIGLTQFEGDATRLPKAAR